MFKKNTFTALCILLLTAFGVHGQTVIQVAEGTGAISAAYATAQAGDIIELTTSGGLYIETAKLAVDKAITIRAAAGLASMPVWASNNATVDGLMNVSANLTLLGITLDGNAAAGKTGNAIITKGNGYTIKLLNSVFKNFGTADLASGSVIYGSSDAQVDTVIVTNCIFSDLAKYGILFNVNTTVPGAFKNLFVTNSTFFKMKEPFYIDASDNKYDGTTPDPNVLIKNVTFYNTLRVLSHYINFTMIENCIFANPAAGGNSYYIYGNDSECKNSLYWNAPMSLHTAKNTNNINADPLFKDAANGDFTLLEGSPALNAGTDGKNLGDPRWTVKTGVTTVTAGTGNIAAAVAAAEPGAVIELVTDGGLYIEQGAVKIDKALTIRAAENMINKPVWTSDSAGYLVRPKATLTLEGITFDGTKGATINSGAIAPEGRGYNLTVKNCDIFNFPGPGEGYGIILDKYNGVVDSLVVTGCYFKNLLNKGVYIGSHSEPTIGSVHYLNINNSTFTKTKEDAIYIRDNDGVDATPGPVMIVDHCTFYDASVQYGLIGHHIDGAVVKNCIAAFNPAVTGKTAYYLYGANSSLKNSIYFNMSVNLHDMKAENQTNNITADPMFVDAASGNFMLEKNSPAVNAGDDGSTIGDPRWGVSTVDVTKMVLLKSPYSMSPTQNSVRIVWETPLNQSDTSIVEFGKTTAYGSKVTGAKGWVIEGEGVMHEVTLTGLEAFTEYYYRVSDGLGYSDSCMTKTAAAPGTNFRLLVGGDSRDNPGVWKDICTSALNDKVDMGVFVGDYITNGNVKADWTPEFFTPGNVLFSKRPFIGVIGNHETADGLPMTYYDYMSLPVHPENGDADPEAYYSMVYGDVNFIMINSNGNFGDSKNVEFTPGSPQYAWLTDQLANNTSKWVFVVQHTPVFSTSLHGQWTETEKQVLAPLYENYAKSGKHIVVFNGDDHNFEHLYKDGVNYIRPAGGGASLYNNGLNTADNPWSIYFQMVHNYSTIDVRGNGDTLIVKAKLQTGEVFYETVLTTSGTPPPNIYIIEPDGKGDEASDSYKITWSDSDPDDDAKIALYYATDKTTDGKLIVKDISEDDPQNSYVWDVSGLTPGQYWIYGIADDGKNPPVKRYSNGPLTVFSDTLAPPPALGLKIQGHSAHSLKLSWTTPTGNIPVEKVMGTFKDSLDNFVGAGQNPGDKGLLTLVPGQTDQAMRISYTVAAAWGQFGAFKYFNNFPDWRSVSTIDFWYRGDGSSRALRLIVSQDNDRNGVRDDMWYTEKINLSSTDWQHASIEFKELGDLSFDVDVDKEFDQENIYSLDFIIPSATAGSGTLDIDEVRLLGEIPAAEDFKGTVIVRRTDRFPTSVTDGTEVYRGTATSYVDSNLVSEQTYYYAAFTFDEVPNYSQLDTSSVKSASPSSFSGLKDVKTGMPKEFKLAQNYPNPFNPHTIINFDLPKASKVKITIYSALGEEVVTLLNQEYDAGYHSVAFNGSRLSSGLYLYKLEAGSFQSVKKMLLLK